MGVTLTFGFISSKYFNHYFPLIDILLPCTATFYLFLPFKAIDENKEAFALEEESRLLKEVEELKRNFMNLMSHDLKTPIAKNIWCFRFNEEEVWKPRLTDERFISAGN